jgi:hypothetical protein
MPGEPGWLKTYYHAPQEKDSKYKGVYRNLLLASIVARVNRKDSEQKISDGRPVQSERYMWSPTDGLVKVLRTPEPNKKGDGYTKKNNNKIIDGPYKDPNEIAKVLNLGTADSLYSYETLRKAMDENYPSELVKLMLKDFSENPTVRDIGIPTDIKLSESVGTTDWFRTLLDIVK